MSLLLTMEGQTAEDHAALFTALSLAIQGHAFRPPQKLNTRFDQRFLDHLANTAYAHLDQALLMGYRNKGHLMSNECSPLNEVEKIKRRIEDLADAPPKGK